MARSILLLLFVLPVHVQAQTVHGIVVEEATKTPIAGVHVEMVDEGGRTAAAASTDTAGAFVLAASKGGKFLLRLSHPGWVASAPAGLRLSANERIGVELRMSRTVLPLEPLVVTSRRDPRTAGFYNRVQSRGTSGQYVTRKQIEARPGARTTDFLRNLTGVDIQQVGRGFASRTQMVTMRGGAGRCVPTFYIDGIPVRQMPESGLDDWLHPAGLEGMEVYTRTASGPPDLPSRNTCGVVAFWTKSDMGQGRRWSWLRAASTVGVFSAFVLLAQ